MSSLHRYVSGEWALCLNIWRFQNRRMFTRIILFMIVIRVREGRDIVRVFSAWKHNVYITEKHELYFSCFWIGNSWSIWKESTSAKSWSTCVDSCSTIIWRIRTIPIRYICAANHSSHYVYFHCAKRMWTRKCMLSLNVADLLIVIQVTLTHTLRYPIFKHLHVGL